MKNFFVHKFIDRDDSIMKTGSGKKIYLPKVITDEQDLRTFLNIVPDFENIYKRVDYNIKSFVRLRLDDNFIYGLGTGMEKLIGSIQRIKRIYSDGTLVLENPLNDTLLDFAYSVDDISETITDSLEKYKFDKETLQWKLF